MDSIVVNVSELYAKACLLKNEKMSYVKLTISEADAEDPEDQACINFEAISSKHPEEAKDYEDIYEVPNDVYKFD